VLHVGRVSVVPLEFITTYDGVGIAFELVGSYETLAGLSVGCPLGVPDGVSALTLVHAVNPKHAVIAAVTFFKVLKLL